MKIQLPKTVNAICTECNEKQETNWDQFGSLLPCINCDAAPVRLEKVGA